jgi:hypothetical protein
MAMILNPRLFMWTPPVMKLMLIVGTTGNYPYVGGTLVSALSDYNCASYKYPVRLNWTSRSKTSLELIELSYRKLV